MAVRELTQADVRHRLRYVPETGALVRLVRTRHSEAGARLSGFFTKGHRRAWFLGENRQTAHLVWLYHYGELPSGFLRHKNGDNADDRIENLEVIKKAVRMVVRLDGLVTEYGRLNRDISGIYEIVCTANGRRYVGSAVNVDKRWRDHVTQLGSGKHHSRHLQRAWNKHGQDEFAFRLVEECARDDLIQREQHYIDTMKPEFNSRPVAGSQLGWSPSEETRAKMRAARARNPSSPMKGRKHNPESLRRLSENRKGKYTGYRDPEIGKKISAALKGRVISTEQRARISAKLRGHVQSAETISKRIATIRGNRNSSSQMTLV